MDEYKWWNDPGWVSDITMIARDLVDEFPEHKIISVGQSPAWITMGVGMIRRLRGEDANIGFVPFTGNYMESAGDEEIKLRRNGRTETTMARSFKTAAGRPLDPEVAARYQSYLGKLKLSPDDLAGEMEQGKKFIFCDLTRTGGGLASFMSAWSENTSPEVCRFLGTGLECLAFAPEAHKDKTHFKINTDLVVPMHTYALDFDRFDRMMSTSSSNHVDEKSTRLMATYQLYSTPSRPAGMHIAHNAPVTREIKGVLHRDIQYKEQNGKWPQKSTELVRQDCPEIVVE